MGNGDTFGNEEFKGMFGFKLLDDVEGSTPGEWVDVSNVSRASIELSGMEDGSIYKLYLSNSEVPPASSNNSFGPVFTYTANAGSVTSSLTNSTTGTVEGELIGSTDTFEAALNVSLFETTFQAQSGVVSNKAMIWITRLFPCRFLRLEKVAGLVPTPTKAYLWGHR